MTKKIFITRKIPQNGIDMLKEQGYEIVMNDKDIILTKEELKEKLRADHFDAVITQLTNPIDASFYDEFPHITLYANYATGFDNIDIERAKEKGITITNAPTELSSSAVAEYTIALLYTLSRRIVEADRYTRAGQYTGWNAMNFVGDSLSGKTLGLVGTGAIGARVGEYAKAVGMNIIYTDVKRNETFEQATGAQFKDSIDVLLPEADIISLHVPLLPSTQHLINKERLTLMKSSSYLINTARGAVIDEEALTVALAEKRIAGAALDVFEHEPLLSEKLKSLPNVILTPHIASANLPARQMMAETVAYNVIDYFEGKTPRNVVVH